MPEADAIIVELGANALRGINPDVTRANLTQIIEKSRARGLQILLAGMLARPIWPDLWRSFAAYIPISPANMIGALSVFSTGWPRRNLLIWADGIHPMPLGIDIIVSASALTPSVSFQM